MKMWAPVIERQIQLKQEIHDEVRRKYDEYKSQNKNNSSPEQQVSSQSNTKPGIFGGIINTVTSALNKISGGGNKGTQQGMNDPQVREELKITSSSSIFATLGINHANCKSHEVIGPIEQDQSKGEGKSLHVGHNHVENNDNHESEDEKPNTGNRHRM